MSDVVAGDEELLVHVALELLTQECARVGVSTHEHLVSADMASSYVHLASLLIGEARKHVAETAETAETAEAAEPELPAISVGQVSSGGLTPILFSEFEASTLLEILTTRSRSFGESFGDAFDGLIYRLKNAETCLRERRHARACD